METNIDQHKFGVGDYLSADDYAEGMEVKTKVLAFLGRQEYVAKDGTSKRSAMYKVDAQGIGVPQSFRFGIKNEKVAAKKGIKSYEELVGKTLIMKVKHFQLGNGFILVDVK